MLDEAVKIITPISTGKAKVIAIKSDKLSKLADAIGEIEVPNPYPLPSNTEREEIVNLLRRIAARQNVALLLSLSKDEQPNMRMLGGWHNHEHYKTGSRIGGLCTALSDVMKMFGKYYRERQSRIDREDADILAACADELQSVGNENEDVFKPASWFEK